MPSRTSLLGRALMSPLCCAHHHLQQEARFSFIHSFISVSVALQRTAHFQFFFFSFWNSSENLVLCYIYVVFVYCSVVCCSDLKYQENIQCRKDRSGPKNLRMMRAACDLLHISKLTARVVAEHWVTYMTGRLYHALGWMPWDYLSKAWQLYLWVTT